jgi:MSHA biogenesis protein MshM
MYEHFFALSEAPFSLTPDTRYFVPAQSHYQAWEMLRVALQNREGFIKLVGEVGTGKTLLCRCLLNDLQGNWVTAYIHNPGFSPAGLYRTVLEELGGICNGVLASHRLLKKLNDLLLILAAEGRRVVLLIDEAQAMPDATLEALRLLTNLETESQKLLQVVLMGQPELDRKLGQDHLRQLGQRISFGQQLLPLTRQETALYIEHRLRVAGYQGMPVFTGAAIRALHRASRGIPRLVNIIAHKAMLVAYGKDSHQVDARFVMRAASDTEAAFSLPAYWPLLSGWG